MQQRKFSCDQFEYGQGKATSSRNSKPLSGYTSRPVLAQSSESPGGSANLESAASPGRDRYGAGKRCHPYPYLSRRENYRNKIATPVQSSALPRIFQK